MSKRTAIRQNGGAAKSVTCPTRARAQRITVLFRVSDREPDSRAATILGALDVKTMVATVRDGIVSVKMA